MPAMSEPAFRHLKHHIEQGALVLTITRQQLQGDEVADQLRQEMLAALEQSGLNKVVIDFHQVVFLSSASFRPWLSMRRKLHDSQGQLVLCGMSAEVAEVFYVTRLVSTSGASSAPFHMEPDVPRALARLNAPVA